MVNYKIFSILFVLLFSPIILGQSSPNIIWEVQAFADEINYLSISADGNTILASDQYTSNFYDNSGNFIDSYTSGHWIEGGSISPTTEYFTVGYCVGIQGRGYSLVINTEDHSVLATIQGNLSVFNSNESKLVTAERYDVGYIYNIPNWNNPVIFSSIAILSIDVSEDYFAIGGHYSPDNCVLLKDITTGDLIYTFTDFNNNVSAVKFSPDGSFLASGQGYWDAIDGAIKIWNLNDYSLIADLNAFTYMTNSITFSADGLYMIAAGRNGNISSNFPEIKIWRTTDWNLIKTYDSDLDNYVSAVVNLPDSYKFVYSTGEGHLALADYTEVVPVELTSFGTTTFNLAQNYPNPFNPTTNIRFSVPESGNVKLAVYNTLGQEVAVLVNGMVTIGQHDVTFDASSLPSGAYIYKFQTNNSVMVKKMLLLK